MSGCAATVANVRYTCRRPCLVTCRTVLPVYAFGSRWSDQKENIQQLKRIAPIVCSVSVWFDVQRIVRVSLCSRSIHFLFYATDSFSSNKYIGRIPPEKQNRIHFSFTLIVQINQFIFVRRNESNATKNEWKLRFGNELNGITVLLVVTLLLTFLSSHRIYLKIRWQ